MNKLKVKGKQKFMNLEIPVIEGGFGEDKKCMTDKTISEIHNQPNFKIRERIKDNIKRFKEDIDYIDLKVIRDTDDNLELLQTLGYSKMQISKADNIFLLSERGYSKLIKIMDTDLAWEIHDKIMDEYFSMRKKLNNPFENLSPELKVIIKLEQRQAELESGQHELEEKVNVLYDFSTIDYNQQETIRSLVNRMVIQVYQCLNFSAYEDAKLRKRVYFSLWKDYRKKFGVNSYKNTAKKNYDNAIKFIENWEPNYDLSNEIYMFQKVENI
ncbi:TPA: ORF6C domain-containing protein [Clostridioides difficile]|uniref:ORF6C domain-containing protein n=2 Tax=Clostridioides difficile TaxID=1496 RepID=UPI000980121B|nr:ORF6C domain-containing protein [Clostridioides difficile]MBY1048236.1 ORF6C domain-containing protein [Clostridioides difficile]SJS23882.1 ORF6C domain [Clostridioides difficile]SJU07866.1 ORF6C domain [Clostridioides difficile]SJU42011.1 ORF6C domain [Clostridioides difficile]SJU45483.1 ORF6C domain [Clostridioides difficile]